MKREGNNHIFVGGGDKMSVYVNQWAKCKKKSFLKKIEICIFRDYEIWISITICSQPQDMSDVKQEPPDEYSWLFNNRWLNGRLYDKVKTSKTNKQKEIVATTKIIVPCMQTFKYGRR